MERLASWLTRSVGGRLARFVGAYHYTGVFEGESALGGFLTSLETKTGYFVRREPRVRRTSTCRSCGSAGEYFTEKRVDTRLVAEMIQLAAVGAYDVACLLSGDDDFLPAVQSVGALGKQVYLATWPGQGVARELRANSFGVIDLSEGVGEFGTGRRRPAVPSSSSALPPGFGQLPPIAPIPPTPAPALDATGALTPVGAALLNEIRNVQAQLPYVGRWYFCNKWRGTGLPSDSGVRERMIDELIAGGWIQADTATDDKGRAVQAVRVVEGGTVSPQAGGGAVGYGWMNRARVRPQAAWLHMPWGSSTCCRRSGARLVRTVVRAFREHPCGRRSLEAHC